jgi:site-specific recombinase XerD
MLTALGRDIVISIELTQQTIYVLVSDVRQGDLTKGLLGALKNLVLGLGAERGLIWRVHSMRRTMLTSLSRAGVPLRTVQEILGHSSLTQLQTYLAVDPEDTREALQRLKY